MKLFTPFQLGPWRLTHRVVMPPLTRMAHHTPLNAPDRSTFYGGTEHGYTDYPRLQGHGADVAESCA